MVEAGRTALCCLCALKASPEPPSNQLGPSNLKRKNRDNTILLRHPLDTTERGQARCWELRPTLQALTSGGGGQSRERGLNEYCGLR